MIGGLLVIVGLFVIRFPSGGPQFPAEIRMPDNASAQAVTYGQGWYGVVTDDNRFLIFDSNTGQLGQTVRITVPSQN